VLAGAGEPERGIELFTELVRDSTRLLGEHHPHTVAARYRLGLAARNTGRLDLAAEQLELVSAEWSRRFGPDSGRVRRVREQIARLHIPDAE
jgi:hypothetical protein